MTKSRVYASPTLLFYPPLRKVSYQFYSQRLNKREELGDTPNPRQGDPCTPFRRGTLLYYPQAGKSGRAFISLIWIKWVAECIATTKSQSCGDISLKSPKVERASPVSAGSWFV